MSTDIAGVVERLRSIARDLDRAPAHLCFESATLIESLSAQVEEMKNELFSLKHMHGGQIHIAQLYDQSLLENARLRALLNGDQT